MQISDNDYRLWTLNDPFIKVVPDANDPTALDVLFVDRYPFRRSLDADGALPFEWRYQLVYFDSNHLPVEYRVSDWFAEGSL